MMITYRPAMAAISIVLLATVGARAETPLALWQAVPALPGVSETAECAEIDNVAASIEEAAAKALTEAQFAMAKMTPAAVSDAQGQAIEQLMDYSLQECALDAETEVWQLVQTARERLSGAMTDLEARRIEALDKCGNEMSPGYGACYKQTRLEYQALAGDTADRLLDAVGADYAAWRDGTRECVERRENAVSRFDAAGVAGPFAAQGLNVRTQTWMLVGLHARTSSELCFAFHEASHGMDID